VCTICCPDRVHQAEEGEGLVDDVLERALPELQRGGSRNVGCITLSG
jgi:hypothetical protein